MRKAGHTPEMLVGQKANLDHFGLPLVTQKRVTNEIFVGKLFTIAAVSAVR